jgi:lysozyme
MATPLVADISRYEVVTDFNAAFAAGLRGIIHKATQGDSYVDPKYAERKDPAIAAGLLYGAYHFADASPVSKQVDHFLTTVRPDLNPNLCLALDLEENSPRHGGTMSLDSAKEWCRLVYRQTGQWPVLYSGNLLKQYLNGHPDIDIAHLRLWLAQYGPHAILPPGWTNYWLHQYTGDGVGPGPHTWPGIAVDGPNQGLDLNYFGGTDLGKEWSHVPQVSAPVANAAPAPAPRLAPVASLANQTPDVIPGATPITPMQRKAAEQVPGLYPASGLQSAFALPPVDPKTADKWDIISASRRLRLGRFQQSVLKATGGATTLSFAMFQQVRDFCTDWRALAVLVVGVLAWIGLKWMESQTINEVREGRYVPSGMAQGNNDGVSG